MEKNIKLMCLLSFGFVLIGWSLALFVAPSEMMMGEPYRILYLHVPSAAVALGLASLGLLVTSLLGLLMKQDKYLFAARAWSEIGLVFVSITLASGAIWGKPTWGAWWTWDARLTTTFVLALLFVGYLLLYNALPAGKLRVRVCSILGIIIFVDVPIIYNSVKWWRTLHQPASIIEQRGATYSSEMFSILMMCIVFTLIFASALWWLRFQNLKLQAELDANAQLSLH